MLRKKLVSMLLVLAMALGMCGAALAAEEEPAATNESAPQASETHTHVYHVSDYQGVDPDDYTKTEHVYVREGHLHRCNCGDQFIEAEKWEYQSHQFIRIREVGVVIGGNGETVPTYLYKCLECNYSKIDT